ncbi:MAG: hypothetical protein R6U98_01160 [Pirellulaceae bacterium]
MLVNEEQVYNPDRPISEKQSERLEAQAQALAGKHGMILKAVSAEDGTERFSLELDSSPVFDGMSAARGRLLISRKDGTLVCLGQ